MDPRSSTDSEIDPDEVKSNPEAVPPKIASMISTVTSFGYDEDFVRQAVRNLREKNAEISYDSLIDASSDIQNLSLSGPGSLQDAVTSLSLGATASSSSSSRVRHRSAPAGKPTVTTGDRSEERYQRLVRRALVQKKQELSTAIEALRYKCRVCNAADANILLLPCAHFVCCDGCLMDVRRCPLARCNKIVRGTKEVYFA